MRKSLRILSVLLTACIVLGFGGWIAHNSAEAGPLVMNKDVGDYKDLSYETLTDEGMSWEERTRLFGGETVHYGELTTQQRQAKQKELDSLLKKIDTKLVKQCDADIRKWLDRQIAAIPPAYADNKEQYSYKLRGGAVVFFRAYEIFGDKKYLDAGLKCADLVLKAQSPRGHWGGRSASGNIVRIQDGTTTVPFWIVLYAYKVSGDKKYFESARRAADVLLSAQSGGGGWPDQWVFSGSSGSSGVSNGGITFNDNGTNAPFQIMVIMYHITKDKKYIAKLGNLWPFIVKTNLGKGEVVGWAEQYHGDGRPARARGYEIELPYPRSLTRAVGPLLIWLYLMTGDEAQMELMKKAYAWHEYVRKQDMKPENWKYWKILHDACKKKGLGYHYRPGWPDAWLPEGSNWGRVTGYHMFPWFPLTAEMKKKHGGLFAVVDGYGKLTAEMGYLHVWAKASAVTLHGVTQASNGNAMVQVRRALLEHKRGGRKGLLKYYSNPTKYTSDQHLQARVDAAKRALDKRNVKLAANPEKKGILAITRPGHLIGQKGRWYGAKHSKWGAAYYEYMQEISEGKWGSVAWYQWQLVYDTMLARGNVSADAAARGGRGLENAAWMTHLDSWDVLGEWGMACHEMENYFDVPIGKK